MKAWLWFLASFLVSAAASLALAGVAPFDLGAVSGFWASAEPMRVVWHLALALMGASFLASLITRDHSWVDRLWSTAPVAFAWFYAWRGGFSLPVLLLAVLVTLWGGRLSYNFAIKGGYTGTEDYRWAILRGRIRNPLLWQLFNLGFICAFQISLLVLFSLPVALVAGSGAATGAFPAGAPMLWAVAALFLGFLALETVADVQQWRFQAAKRAVGQGGQPHAHHARALEEGFISYGLYHYSRHPNYFAEIMMWWTVLLYALVCAGSVPWWAVTGAALLTLLFMGSTRFTEEISAQKYPAYRLYQKRVSALVPWPPRV